jgi:hypothetical protein
MEWKQKKKDFNSRFVPYILHRKFLIVSENQIGPTCNMCPSRQGDIDNLIPIITYIAFFLINHINNYI